ncbi:SAP domain [Popillia japonica]|uniref:SAP domain n=1 Tax=Popillia japonica TaxID=7064 RepID=A0AAW1HWE2_POPJA
MSDKDNVVCKIKSLRVKDLQRQLEKRGINQSGKKAVLIKRLKDVLNSSFIDLSEQSITERELAGIKSLLIKVRKDKIQNEVNTKDKKIAECTSDRKISVTSEFVSNNDLHDKLAKIPPSLSCDEAPGNSRSNRLTDVRSTHAKELDKQVAVEQIAVTGAVDYNSRVETTDGAGNLRELRTDSGEESGQGFSDVSTDESDDTVMEQSESNFMCTDDRRD